MALTDTFVKNVKPARAAGDKHADGDGMYLLVTPAGKYRRASTYRVLGKRKTPALGVYPLHLLGQSRHPPSGSRTLLADGIDPGEVKREAKRARIAASGMFLRTRSTTNGSLNGPCRCSRNNNSF